MDKMSTQTAKQLIGMDWLQELKSLEERSWYITTIASTKNDKTINCYYDPHKLFSKFILLRFAQSCGNMGRIFNATKVNKLFPGTSAIFGPNCLDSIARPCLKNNQDLLFIDHGYFGNDYNRPGISGAKFSKDVSVDSLNFRITYNKIHQTEVYSRPSDRLKQFRVKIQEWQHNKDGHLLFCPPTGRMNDILGVGKKWFLNTLSTLRANTDRHIIIRAKPGITSVEHFKAAASNMKNVTFREHSKYQNLDDDLKNCWAVIAPASVVSIHAIIAGIPSFCEPTSPAKGVSLHDYSKIESPIYPDRMPLLYNLAYSQFSVSEITSGFAFQMLRKDYPQAF